MASVLSQPETAEDPIVGELVAQVDWRHAMEAVLLFLVFAGLFTVIQYATPALVGNDGYYHIRLADIMRQEGMRVDFHWLPLTILNEHAYYDHHMLYHVILALFVPGDPGAPVPDATLITAAKMASIVLPALAFVSIWWLLDRQGVPWPSIWALALFAVSDAFLFRMSMVRAQSISLMVLALGLHWLLQERHWPLMGLGFVYVWLYNAFPLLLVVAAVVVITRWLTGRGFNWRGLTFPAAGIGLGLLINPYFPQNLIFILQHLVPKFGAAQTGLGNEWFPYDTWDVVVNSTGALALCVLGAYAIGWRGQRMSRSTLIALILAVMFGLMMFKARRFVEYFPAFALIFGAFSLSPMLDRWASVQPQPDHPWDPRGQALVPLLLTLILVVPLVRSLQRAREAVASQRPADSLAGAANWLEENTPPGSMIFQTDWDDFTRLFFYNTASIYTAGLDPTYLELSDAELYDLWVRITRGEVDQPSTAIREEFGGAYVVSDLDHTAFLRDAEDDPGLREVYRDDDAVVYEVLP